MNRIRCSMIGLGPWGQKVATRMGELASYQWVGLCDRSFKDLDSLSHKLGATPFRNSQSLFDFYLPDLLLIATPVESHFELIIEGLHRGCHIWVTKPVLLHLHQLEEVLNLAGKKNLKLFFDHTYCFSSRFQAISNFLPLLSPVKRIESQRGHWGGGQKGSSALEELIYHDIYMSLQWAQRTPEGISFKYLDEKNEKERTEQLTLHFNSSLTINLKASHGWKDRLRQISITGADWKIDWNDDALSNPIQLKKSDSESGVLQDLNLKGDAIYRQMLEISECLIKKKTPTVMPEQALQVLKVIEKARASLRNGGEMVSYD